MSAGEPVGTNDVLPTLEAFALSFTLPPPTSGGSLSKGKIRELIVVAVNEILFLLKLRPKACKTLVKERKMQRRRRLRLIIIVVQ